MWFAIVRFALASDVVPPPIVGGSPVGDGTWPDAVAFVDVGNQPYCTGTLVAPDLVVTAAHCVEGFVGAVRVGSINSESGGWLVPVTRVQRYPNWENTFDVAFVVLSKEVPFEPRRPAVGCVAEGTVDDAEIVVAGWGMTRDDGTGPTTRLRQVTTTIQDADCRALTLGCQRSAWPAGELIAGGDGEGACYGDSGGPVYLMSEHGPHLVGITSRRINAPAPACGWGAISVRIDAVQDWIESLSGRKLLDPVCGHPPRPVAPDIVARGRRPASTTVDPGDVDAGETHRFEVVVAPENGEIEVDGATLTYRANRGFVGEDAVTVRVTDSSTWDLTAELTIPIQVEEGGACNGTGTDVTPWAWLVLLGLRRRR